MNFTPITVAINHLLAQEPWAQRKLAAHAGKIAYIDSGAIVFKWQITDDGMLQTPVFDALHTAASASLGHTTEDTAAETRASIAPNVTIRMKLSDLPLMAQNPERAFSYVNIEGDADLASVISQVGMGIRWDAEQDLSKWVGDIAATRMVSAAKATLHTVKTTHQKLAENLAEYFLEEKPLLVRPHAVSDFTREVTILRDDMERLIKRVERLERSRNGPPSK
ncbi:ubiquinone biosynthesis accessory factor UbiJ [Glaciimonas immobilis]|uniref:Ubiquinone biosynthesis accessory factor UbiJ n=1 Tax=Glaciimonas immobilis TaxID=728004 RepID=A0A840RYC2_9BURK|nr:sterol-binding protein [Glaciimonas immobilis]MBB5201389.1 ubiquinone biosynthesis protein UbiJ [Glaciimonas immobilis]